MKKLLFGLVLALQLIAAGAQTFKTQNLQVLGTSSFTGNSSFSIRPTVNGNTVWDTGNFNPASYAPLASPVFTGTPTVPGYLTSSLAATTYAPLASPTFTGTVTIPSGASIAGYLSSATAASTYAPLSSPTFTGTATAGSFSGAGTGLTGTAASLNIGGTAAKATAIAGGSANQIPFQSGANVTSFVTAPTTSGTCLQWNGTSLTWAACSTGGGGSVSSVAASGGTTGLTFTGSPITSSGTLTLGGTLAVANGGTGLATLTSNAVLLGAGTGNVGLATTGTYGKVLFDNGSGNAPSFQDPGPYILTGADPNGIVDATSIFQAAINYIVPRGLELRIPSGTYKLSSQLSIPFGAGWKIVGSGQGGTILNQTASNTGIFYFNTASGGTGPYSWQISDLTFQYSTQQSTSNNNSIAIQFDNSSNTYFNFDLDRLTFINCYRGVGTNKFATTTVWGATIRDMTYGSTNTGSAVNFGTGSAGQPNISIDGLYIVATNIATAENLIQVANNDSGWYNHIEVNGAANGNTIMYLSGQAAIGSVKVEVGTWGTGTYLFRFPNAHISIAQISMVTMTISASGGAVYGIDANGGGGGSTIDIGQTYLTFNGAITGNFYLVNGGTAPAYSVRFRSTPQGLLGTTGAFLTQTPAAVGANGVSVDDWQQNRLSADYGDTNGTWTNNQPNQIVYNTTLTANRTITLSPAANGSTDTNLYNGQEVCVLRTATTPGNFTLTVNNWAGSAIGSFPANERGKLCFMWYRGNSNWTQTSSENWTTNTLSATGTSVAMPTNTPTPVASVTLTPGTWLVIGGALISESGTSMTNTVVGISTSNSSFGAAGTYTQLTLGSQTGYSAGFPPQIITVASNTTYYLLTNAGYAGGSASGTGTITAKRLPF